MSCAALADLQACDVNFSDIWTKPPAGTENTKISAKCPRACNQCRVQVTSAANGATSSAVKEDSADPAYIQGTDLMVRGLEAWKSDPHVGAPMLRAACEMRRRVDLAEETPTDHPLLGTHFAINGLVRTDSFVHVNRVKLRHDAEQLELLVERGRLPAQPHTRLAELYRQLAGLLPNATNPDRLEPQLMTMDESTPKLFRRAFNRAHHLYYPERLEGPTLNPRDWAAVERSYYASGLPDDPHGCTDQNGFAILDGVLTDAALESLRRWCDESTMWFASKPGYLGAFHQEAFSSPLLLQLADELRAALPGLLGRHPLNAAWAFKYSNDEDDWPPSGINVHADKAAVNLNLWLSASDANLEEGSGGGLVVYKQQAPASMDQAQYNNETAEAQERLHELFKDAERIDIPHRQNRLVVFNSNLLHKSMPSRFKPGYRNRRINLTLLFGARCRGAGQQQKPKGEAEPKMSAAPIMGSDPPAGGGSKPGGHEQQGGLDAMD